MNTQIIIHTGQYAGGIEDGEILFQVDEGVTFIPNVGDTLRYCLLEIPNDEIVEIMKSQLLPNDLKDIVNKLNEE